jgi:carbamoyl-phosphate synthase small subunit
MTGYEESLTDPSYTGQILTFTYPLIGNYGIPPRSRWESKKIHTRGVVVSSACHDWSHNKSTQSLLDWLKAEQVPIIMGVDTRALTKVLRESGVMLGAINNKIINHKSEIINHFIDPNKENLVAQVSCAKKTTYGKGKKRIIMVDCGMKENIVRCLAEYPATLIRVPYNYDYTNEKYDGVFLSNGPGDPSVCTETITILKKAMALQKPIFGICLGSQLMALAAGAKTYKLPYGHRSQNQPCLNTATNSCVLTSQNHGFAVDETTLPKGWYVNFRNLNDGTVEGIAHKTLPFFSVQFHPEASPGPVDTKDLFEKFYALL